LIFGAEKSPCRELDIGEFEMSFGPRVNPGTKNHFSFDLTSLVECAMAAFKA
jgi:hypothetical protein